MSIINSQPLIGASGNQSTAYNLTRSLRFRSSASAYLNRTPASAGNRKTWTWSAWVKRGTLGSSGRQAILSTASGTSDSTWLEFGWNGSGTDQFYITTYSVATTTTAVYRDPSAWYHIVVAFDTTQATGSNRIKIYVNNVLQANSGGFIPTLNGDYGVNNTQAHNIGNQPSGSLYLDGYLSEVNFVDGQALTPSDFGETDTATGVWKPKKYTGTYGTNGFYLKFDNLTSTSTLGNDSSGNSNTWTVNNISLTSGSTYDSMKDVPTLTDADTANYAVLNPLKPNGSASIINGNLNISPSGTYCNGLSTIDLDSGSYYAECTVTTAQAMGWGIWSNTASTAVNVGTTPTGFYGIYSGGATLMINGTSPYTNAGASPSNGDIVQVAWSNGKVWFGKNNTWYDSTFGTTGNPSTGSNPTVSSLALNTFTIAFCGANASPVLNANFGQQPFAYTPPSGFKALNTFNLPTPTIGATASTQANDYFDINLYTGNGSTQSITNSGGFQPDWVWIKNRTGVYNHRSFDVLRGATKILYQNATDAELTDANSLTSFNSSGFSLGSAAGTNNNTDSFVAWQWKANGAGSSNTAGSITSTVSANTTAGFSIVTYTGNATSGATIGHGLGVSPSMIIVKARSFIQNWIVYHTSLGNTKALFLDLTDAPATNSLYWNNTSPTSSLITLGSGNGTNKSAETYVAYCFAEVAGYSKFGSYTGNGSTDGAFVFTGFAPAFILIKRTDTTGNWIMLDDKRYGYNSSVSPRELYANLSNAEADSGAADILSNGFKLRITGTSYNASGGTYVFMALAENPFKYSLAR